MDGQHDDVKNARSDLARYLNGDHGVPRVDDYGTPAFVGVLLDDLASPPWPLPWPVPAAYAMNDINPVDEVPFGTYAWWVRRLQRTVDAGRTGFHEWAPYG